MNILYANPELATLIHDTNGSLGSMRWYIDKIRQRMKELSMEDRSIENAVEMLESQRKLAIEQIDVYYTKLKAKATKA